MRSVHKICDSKNDRIAYRYIQVKANEVNVTQGFSALITPVTEVFGENVIEQNEELYFLADEWQKSKISSAVKIERDGLFFIGKDRKNNTLGTCKALKVISENYPNVKQIFPSEPADSISSLSIAPDLLQNLKEAMGGEQVLMSFAQRNKSIAVVVCRRESKAKGILRSLRSDNF